VRSRGERETGLGVPIPLLTLSHPVLQITEKATRHGEGKKKKITKISEKYSCICVVYTLIVARSPSGSPHHHHHHHHPNPSRNSCSLMSFVDPPCARGFMSSISPPTQSILACPPTIHPWSDTVVRRRSRNGFLASTVCHPFPCHGPTCESSRTCGPSCHAASPDCTPFGLFHGSS